LIESVSTQPLKITFSDNISFSQSVLKAQSDTMAIVKDSCKNINLTGTNSHDFKNAFVVINSEKPEVTIK
jgi:hypothetical protein